MLCTNVKNRMLEICDMINQTLDAQRLEYVKMESALQKRDSASSKTEMTECASCRWFETHMQQRGGAVQGTATQSLI